MANVKVNVTPKQLGKNTRMSFGKIPEVISIPNLIKEQKSSYQWFLSEGLRDVLREMSNITDYNETLNLKFIDFKLSEKPEHTIEECKDRDLTYAAALTVKAALWSKEYGDVKQGEIFMGNIPLMTDSGTFVINGAERVVVSQLVRSPGVYFSSEKDKTGKDLFSAVVIPNRGAWLELKMDSSDVTYISIDKQKKFELTTFIRSLMQETEHNGSNEDIYELFGRCKCIEETIKKDDQVTNSAEALRKLFSKVKPGDVGSEESGKTYLNNTFFDPKRYDISRCGRYKYNKKLGIGSRLVGHILAQPVMNELTGEIIADAGDVVTQALADRIEQAGVLDAKIVVDVKIIFKNDRDEQEERTERREVTVIGNQMIDFDTALAEFGYDDIHAEDFELKERVFAPVLHEILTNCETKEETIEQIKQRVDELIPKHICLADINATISYFFNLMDGVGTVDDIDHLSNRRIKCVGELMQNEFRIGMAHMERSIREKMNSLGGTHDEGDNGIDPRSIVNTRPIQAQIREFFGSSQLSQFMDQTNPLAELTHKRRLSALGPGGLSRERAGFEVRDVHYTHYGRMCPIETPEGPNIGLISYLATYSRINEYGFIEAPYRKIDKVTGAVTEEVVYMTADVEDHYVVAQGNEPLTEDGHFANEKITVRIRGKVTQVDPQKVDFMDVSPKMVVSVATAMIPFLENDDANRALMGANMQRQAVPLLRTERPFVGTGMEYKAAVDSGVCVLAKEAGTVTYVSADRVIVTDDDNKEHLYRLTKFKRSNQTTCINQKPIVSVGERVEEHQVLADGPATCQGEISLGKNALIGFMTWEGYNYEDAVLLNERLVREDVFTSVHIEEYDTEIRETKLGAESFTRDINNVGEDALKDLDENGIIRIGAEVHAGDILVGKVTPKGETELSVEERLLRAIFGDNAREVRDTSLRLPHGVSGVVIDVKRYNSKECDELGNGVIEKIRVYVAQKRKISVGDKMAGRHGNKGVVSRILPEEDMPFLPDGTPLDIVLNPLGVPSRMNIGQVLEVHLGMAAKSLGWHVMTPVFDGASENVANDKDNDILACFAAANEQHKDEFDKRGANFNLVQMQKVINPSELEIDPSGKFTLYDGRTGEKFDNPVTVGYMYYLKLHHLVDDKIHARSTGPYSLVTQQPLGGKAQFGGQRFGEMEVWALEAYGAAYTLQEILTVKSDDTNGRVATYEAIIKGNNVPQPGVPEAFRVLVKEMQALGLDVRVLDAEQNVIDLEQKYDDDPVYAGHGDKPQSSYSNHMDDDDDLSDVMQTSSEDVNENNGYFEGDKLMDNGYDDIHTSDYDYDNEYDEDIEDVEPDGPSDDELQAIEDGKF